MVVLFVVGEGGGCHSSVLSLNGHPFSRSNGLIVVGVSVHVHLSVSVHAVCASRVRYLTISLGHDIIKWTHPRSIS